MLEGRSLDNVLGWLYTDEQPRRVVGAETRPDYQGLQTGKYSHEYDGCVIPVTFSTKGATGYAGVPPQPMRVPGFDPEEQYAHVNQ